MTNSKDLSIQRIKVWHSPDTLDSWRQVFSYIFSGFQALNICLEQAIFPPGLWVPVPKNENNHTKMLYFQGYFSQISSVYFLGLNEDDLKISPLKGKTSNSFHVRSNSC